MQLALLADGKLLAVDHIMFVTYTIDIALDEG
jgi:hypothetical protein